MAGALLPRPADTHSRRPPGSAAAPASQGHPFLLAWPWPKGPDGGLAGGRGEGGVHRSEPAGGSGPQLPYRGESWLFMSPLKCSNFFSVSSLKEPPEGWASERQLSTSDVQPLPWTKWSAAGLGAWSHHPPPGGLPGTSTCTTGQHQVLWEWSERVDEHRGLRLPSPRARTTTCCRGEGSASLP